MPTRDLMDLEWLPPRKAWDHEAHGFRRRLKCADARCTNRLSGTCADGSDDNSGQLRGCESDGMTRIERLINDFVDRLLALRRSPHPGTFN